LPGGIPGIFTEDLRYVDALEIPDGYRLDSGKHVVNVGSVGQPRDGDWRACYALLGDDLVRFCRIEYDETTIRKIREIQGPDNWLGERLLEGR
jgi:diadenosine tetraphosphatase ApaH/serine/threonine PP2A family protein phosphatase